MLVINIADRIQNLRKTTGMSQEELADRIGVSRQAVSKWESEQSTPDIEKIILLSNYFEVTTDYLLKGMELETERENKSNAVVFAIAGTAFNVIGLITSIVIWLEKQRVYAVGIGLIIMVIGTMIFCIGQINHSNHKQEAKKYFGLINIWVLVFIPLSCCFNMLDGFFGGFVGILAPLPRLGNSFLTFGLCWLVYLIICITSDLFIIHYIKTLNN